jgi:N6-adenosine-specific RNA methylase IME4
MHLRTKWKWKHAIIPYANGNDEIPDGMVVKRCNEEERTFYQMNLFTCSDDVFSFLFNGNNFRVVCMDPPWKTSIIRADAYNTEDDTLMLNFFETRVASLFQPCSTDSEGYLFLWYLNSKRTFALKCLYAAGYELVADETWNKSNLDGNDRGMSRYRGTAEHFFVGRKRLGEETNKNDWKNAVLNDSARLYASHSFSATPFDNAFHSSKPLKFYTDFVPTFIATYAKFSYHPSFKRCKKIDFFTREIQPGFVSAGLQFNAVRMKQEEACCETCWERVKHSDKAWHGCESCERVWHNKCYSTSNVFNEKRPCIFCCAQPPPQILIKGGIYDNAETKRENNVKRIKIEVTTTKSNKRRADVKVLKIVSAGERDFKRERQYIPVSNTETVLKKMKKKRETKEAKRVHVKGPGKLWWPAFILQEKQDHFFVSWENPSSKGPSKEWVHKDSIKF